MGNAAISACDKGARSHEALGMFLDMRLRRLEPDVITYNAAIGACANGARWRDALGMFSDMRFRRLEQDVITYSAAINACEKGARWPPACTCSSEQALITWSHASLRRLQ